MLNDCDLFPSFKVGPPKSSRSFPLRSFNVPSPSTNQMLHVFSPNLFNKPPPPLKSASYAFPSLLFNEPTSPSRSLSLGRPTTSSLDSQQFSSSSSSSVSPPPLSAYSKYDDMPLMDTSLCDTDVICSDSQRGPLFKLKRDELLQFVREELYCTLGSSPTGMTLPVLTSYFSADVREDLPQIAKMLGFCSVNELLCSSEFSDIVEPASSAHVLGAANMTNSFCYKVAEIPRTSHIIRIIRDRVNINEEKERAKVTAILSNPSYEINVIEGKLRLLTLIAELSATTNLDSVFFGDIQAAYFDKHKVPLDKKELKRFFQCGRIKEIVKNLIFEDVCLYEDIKRSGSLYLALKRPIDDIIEDAARITKERKLLNAQKSVNKQNSIRQSANMPLIQESKSQLEKLVEPQSSSSQKEQQQEDQQKSKKKRKQKKYEPELVSLAHPCDVLFTDDVKVREKYTAVQKFSEDFDAVVAKSQLISNHSDSALNRPSPVSLGHCTNIFNFPINADVESGHVTTASHNIKRESMSSGTLTTKMNSMIDFAVNKYLQRSSTIKPLRSRSTTSSDSTNSVECHVADQKFDHKSDSNINVTSVPQKFKKLGVYAPSSSSNHNGEEYYRTYSKFLNHYKTNQKQALKKTSVNASQLSLTRRSKPLTSKSILPGNNQSDSWNTCSSNRVNVSYKTSASNAYSRSNVKHNWSTQSDVSPVVNLPSNEWSGSKTGSVTPASAASKKSLSEVLKKIEMLDFDTASVVSTLPRKLNSDRRIHVPMEGAPRKFNSTKSSVVALPNSNSPAVNDGEESSSAFSTSYTISTVRSSEYRERKIEPTSVTALTPPMVDKKQLKSDILLVLTQRKMIAVKAIEVNNALEKKFGTSIGGMGFLVNFVRQNINSVDVRTLPTSEIVFVKKTIQ